MIFKNILNSQVITLTTYQQNGCSIWVLVLIKLVNFVDVDVELMLNEYELKYEYQLKNKNKFL